MGGFPQYAGYRGPPAILQACTQHTAGIFQCLGPPPAPGPHRHRPPAPYRPPAPLPPPAPRTVACCYPSACCRCPPVRRPSGPRFARVHCLQLMPAVSLRPPLPSSATAAPPGPRAQPRPAPLPAAAPPTPAGSSGCHLSLPSGPPPKWPSLHQSPPPTAPVDSLPAAAASRPRRCCTSQPSHSAPACSAPSRHSARPPAVDLHSALMPADPAPALPGPLAPPTTSLRCPTT
ncbi:vegetative cell wall protein gp1-like [Cryptomeria japonica]|uniref:vegetative cell wall protein gp1-like n=1 Tax=Cryptomeria japonica TaxID=3369 RepID=UPI0027DA6850|nr:vegetative cell wall protein gp1-like [Cryptomeria japonica]